MRKEAVWVTRRLSFCPERSCPIGAAPSDANSYISRQGGGEPLAVRV